MTLSEEFALKLRMHVTNPTERGLTRIALAIASSGEEISLQISKLGLTDASIHMGALGMVAKELSSISESIDGLSNALENREE